MARSRIIKPEFWSDEKLMKVSRDSRLLFIALWNFADDYGVLHNSTRKILGDVFPFDNSVSEKMVETWKNELISSGVLVVYNNFLIIKNWLKHQKVAHPSKPLLTDDLDHIHEILMKHSGNTPTQVERERERERERGSVKDEAEDEEKPNYQKYKNEWNELAKKTNLNTVIKLSDSRREKLKTRLSEPAFDFPAILQKIKECKWLLGQNDRGWKVDFDWILKNDTNYTKVLEGKYDKLVTTAKADYPFHDIHGKYREVMVDGKLKKQYEDGTVR